MQTDYYPIAKDFDDEGAEMEKRGCWDLMKQFLGQPSRIRLTTMLNRQFLDVYFP